MCESRIHISYCTPALQRMLKPVWLAQDYTRWLAESTAMHVLNDVMACVFEHTYQISFTFD